MLWYSILLALNVVTAIIMTHVMVKTQSDKTWMISIAVLVITVMFFFLQLSNYIKHLG